MTDLLTRLALRAVGEGQQVRPRTRPEFGGAEATDRDAAPRFGHEGPRPAAMRHHDARQAPPRDAAVRDARTARGDGRFEARPDGVVLPAAERGVIDVHEHARAPHGSPAPFEPPPRAAEREAQSPEAATVVFTRTPDAGAVVREGQMPVRAEADVFASAARPAARAGTRTRAAAEAVPDMPHDPRPPGIAIEAARVDDDTPPDPDASFPAHVRARAPSGDSRTAVRLARGPRSPAAPVHAALREEPIVHVTIGRVEIRASVPAAPPAPRAAPPGPRRLSLDDYLASRKGPAR